MCEEKSSIIAVFSHFFDLVLALGRYSWDSSSRPFCLLYQSNKVLRIDGRQYSARELIVLISCTAGGAGEGEQRERRKWELNIILNINSNFMARFVWHLHTPGRTVGPLLSAEICSVASPVRWEQTKEKTYMSEEMGTGGHTNPNKQTNFQNHLPFF